MKYYIIEDINGDYIKDDIRYNLIEVSEIFGPLKEKFVKFDTIEEAIQYFKITKIEEQGEL